MSDEERALHAEIRGLREKLARAERCLSFTVEHVKALIVVKSVAELRQVRGGAENWLAKLEEVGKPC